MAGGLDLSLRINAILNGAINEKLTAIIQRIKNLGASTDRTNGRMRKGALENIRGFGALGASINATIARTNRLGDIINRASNQNSARVQKLRKEYERLKQEIGKATEAVHRYEKAQATADRAVAMRNSMRSGLMGTMLGGAAALAPAIGAVKIAMGFEDAMARVKAISGATGKDFAMLTTTARELGSKTVFSATEAAQGMSFLAMAGYKTNQIIAAMPGLLDTAAAGGMELAETSDIVSNILSGFGLNADDTGRVADVLAAGFTSANVSLSQLGYTMKYVAPVAKTVGLSIEQTTAMAGKLGDVGIQGEMAGTVLRSALSNLADLPTEGAKAMQKIGVATKDSSGKMRNLADILKDMYQKTNDNNRLEVFSKAFGKEGASGMIALAASAASGELDKLTKKLENAEGTAAAVARQMNDTTAGAFRMMKSALEDTAIELGDSLLPAIKGFATSLANVLPKVTTFIDDHRKLIIMGLKLVGGLIAAKLAFFTVGVAVTTVITPFVQFTAAISKVRSGLALLKVGAAVKNMSMLRYAINAVGAALKANAIGLILTGVAIAAYAIYENWDAIATWFTALWDRWKGAVMSVWEVLKDFFGYTPLGVLVNNWGGIKDWFEELFTHPLEALSKLLEKVKSFFGFVGKGVRLLVTGQFKEFGKFVVNETPLGKTIEKITNARKEINKAKADGNILPTVNERINVGVNRVVEKHATEISNAKTVDELSAAVEAAADRLGDSVQIRTLEELERAKSLLMEKLEVVMPKGKDEKENESFRNSAEYTIEERLKRSMSVDDRNKAIALKEEREKQQQATAALSPAPVTEPKAKTKAEGKIPKPAVPEAKTKDTLVAKQSKAIAEKQPKETPAKPAQPATVPMPKVAATKPALPAPTATALPAAQPAPQANVTAQSQQTAQAVTRTFTEMSQSSQKAFAEAVAGMNTQLSNFRPADVIHMQMTLLIQRLTVVPLQMRVIGGQIMDGLIAGINEKQALLMSTVAQMANATTQAFKQPLEIHSPSRVFAELGRMVGAGAVEGVDDSTGNLVKSVAGLASDAVNAWDVSDMQINPMNYPLAGNNTSQTNNNANSTINFSPVFNVSGNANNVQESVKESANDLFSQFSRLMRQWQLDQQRSAL